MARTEAVQNCGIMITERWKLYPLDARNWELCWRDDKGTWRPRSRYYQYGSIGQALLYVADELMKEKAREQAMALREAFLEYEAIARSITSARPTHDEAPRTSGLD